MLVPRVHPIVGISKILIRAVSNSSELPYHPKVRAFPFAISKDEAVTRMAVLASACCMGQDGFSSLGAYFFPTLGFKPFQPRQIQRVYIPAWFVDARVEGNITHPRVQEGDSSPQRVTVAFENSYMPGLVFDPLHRISFNHPSLFQSEPAPLSESLLEHEGSEVLCPPYTVSPLALPDFVRSLSPEQTVVAGYHIDPGSIETPFLAAYPVLIPIYLAYYHVDTPDNSFPGLTFMLEAYRKDGRIITHKVLDRIYDSIRRLAPAIRPSQVELPPHLDFLPMASPFRIEPATPFVRLLGTAGIHGAEQRKRAFEEQINERFSLKETMEDYERFVKEAGIKPVDFDDLRVRELTAEEVSRNRNYLMASVGAAYFRHIAQSLSAVADSTRGSDSPGDSESKNDSEASRSVGKQFLENVSSRLQSGQEAMNTSKPEWFKQWEHLQKPSSPKNNEHANNFKSH